MSHYIFMGLVLGLSAGLAPGPMLTLVICETLSKGVGAGVRIALAPLISDLPIVVVSLAALAKLSDFNPILGGISLAGGAMILKMGISGLRTGAVPEIPSFEGGSLTRGVWVNLLNPHPYLFWISVGGPATTRAWDLSPAAALGFILCFYLVLIGSKVGLALVTARTRTFMTGKVYRYTMKGLGAALCILAVILVREGLGLLGLNI